MRFLLVFPFTGGMEGSWQIANGSLVSMSEQQLVDCSTETVGCSNGDTGLAFDFAKTVNVATESSYPYKGVDGTCHTSFATSIPRGDVTSCKSVEQSFAALQSALQTGLVSVAIEADQRAHNCGTNLDGVLAVGYLDGLQGEEFLPIQQQ